MRREDLKPALAVAACIVTAGLVFTGLSIMSMRMAYHRAYAEVASNCRRVRLLTVHAVRFFCAPVARIEVRQPAGPPIAGESTAPFAATATATATGGPTPVAAPPNPAPVSRL